MQLLAAGQATAEAERAAEAVKRRLEDEVRARVAFELKIHRLGNCNLALVNHEKALTALITEHAVTIQSQKEALTAKEAEIVALRGRAAQSLLEIAGLSAALEGESQDAGAQREVVRDVLEERRHVERELAGKTELNIQLQGILEERQSAIESLTERVGRIRQESEAADERVQRQQRHVAAQEASIKGHI